jgi:hypothetical protein
MPPPQSGCGKQGDAGVRQEVLKARFVELMPGKGTGETNNKTTGARENVCEINNEKGNWYHTTSTCKHPNIKKN